MSNEAWQQAIQGLEDIASNPHETRERRQKAREALKKATQGSVVRGANSNAWSDRQKNNHDQSKHIGGTA